MTNTFDAHEQIRNQRALGREQRRRHGADTTRDEAEVRHESIQSWVINLRYVAPLVVTAIIGTVFGGNRFVDYMAGFVLICVAMFIAVWLGRIWGGVRGAFKPHIQMKTENFWFCVGGVAMAIFGIGMQAYGITVSGAVLALTPLAWTVWGRSVMHNTDFARMNGDAESYKAPRIVE